MVYLLLLLMYNIKKRPGAFANNKCNSKSQKENYIGIYTTISRYIFYIKNIKINYVFEKISAFNEYENFIFIGFLIKILIIFITKRNC